MPWHQFMMTSSNGDIFRVTGHLCWEFTGPRSFDVFFDLRLNKRLNKQSWGCWFDTPSSPLWRHRNVLIFRALVPVSKTHSLYVIPFYSARVRGEWRCSWSSADIGAPTTSEWSTISLPTQVRLILIDLIDYYIIIYWRYTHRVNSIPLFSFSLTPKPKNGIVLWPLNVITFSL